MSLQARLRYELSPDEEQKGKKNDIPGLSVLRPSVVPGLRHQAVWLKSAARYVYYTQDS